MTSCNNCLHGEACEFISQRYEKLINDFFNEQGRETSVKFRLPDAEKCPHFKDRSRFVEPPCKVGDKLYFNNVHLQYAKVLAIYIDASGGMFDLDITTKTETVAGYEHFINKDYSFEDIGKRIFLTKEQAEQALKERERK